MAVRLNDPVRLSETGEVTTIAALAAEGRIRFVTGTHERRVRDSVGGKYKTVTHYHSELLDGSGFWPISKAAYLSRTGKKVTDESLSSPPE